MKSAGLDPLEDRYRVGYIDAVNDFLKADITEIDLD